ncbi:MAG TPA: SagB/ThcOx family dehydrogenase [Candidatus Limnocylindrales bacterium]|nr:SagB/ThcOx family dehydrogenase [Candidatus Limnocylindrales bacterium]
MEPLKSINAVELVYGHEPERTLLDDPAEAYHEASKLYPTLAWRQTDAALLERNPHALVTTTRSVKQLRHLRYVSLPPPAFGDAKLGDVLRTRRSKQSFASAPISLEQFATILFAACGVTQRIPVANGGELVLRTAPSGGALYPLDLYVAVHRVEGLEPGLYFYDPVRHAVAAVRESSVLDECVKACIYPDAVSTSAVNLFLSAMLWRTRFKYRYRAYRFTAIEAGHVVQNVLLTAHSLGLGAVPLGGFYDVAIEQLLGIDGVNEAALYAVTVGAL